MPPRPGAKVPGPPGLGANILNVLRGEPQGTIGTGSTRAIGRVAYQVVRPEAEHGDADAHATMILALKALADFPEAELREVEGRMRGGGNIVALEGATLVRRASRDECFEAWLRAVYVKSPNVVLAEKTAREAQIGEWKTLLEQWQGWETTIGSQAVLELTRLQRAPADAHEYEALLAAARAGDTAAAARLETAAFRRRELMAFRWARAIADGIPDLARIYAGRIGT